MNEFNQGIQWAKLEEITNRHTEETQLLVKVYHSLEDTPIVKLVPSVKVMPGYAFIGAFNSYDRTTDMSYETENIRLKQKIEHLTNKLRELEDKIDTIKKIV